MSASRRDFEAIARAIRELRHHNFTPEQVDEVAESVGRALDSTSTTFQLARFIEACKGGRKK